MLRTTQMSSEFHSDIAEKVISLLKNSLGNTLDIFIIHRFSDRTNNLVFDYNEIKYSIKIYEDDNLIFCGIEQLKNGSKIINDKDLLLLIGERNALFVAEETVRNFIDDIVNKKYDYVKFISHIFNKLDSNIDFNNKSHTDFIERLLKFHIKKATLSNDIID